MISGKVCTNMITRFSKYEAVRWYKGGKLGKIEQEKDPVVEHDDFIKDDEFRNFLIDNNCYHAYIKNIEYQQPSFKNNMKNEPRWAWLDYCFTWSDTDEGEEYWSNLNDKWKKLIGRDL